MKLNSQKMMSKLYQPWEENDQIEEKHGGVIVGRWLEKEDSELSGSTKLYENS